LSGSALIAAAVAAGQPAASEAFSDRGYLASGALAPRDTAGAVISDPELVSRRAIAMVLDQHVVTLDGASIPLRVETLCVHSDTPGAGLLAAAVRRALEDAGVDRVHRCSCGLVLKCPFLRACVVFPRVAMTVMQEPG